MNTMHVGVTAEEIDNRRDVDEVFGNHHGGTHEYLQPRVLKSTRFVQGKPSRVKDRTTVESDQYMSTRSNLHLPT